MDIEYVIHSGDLLHFFHIVAVVEDQFDEGHQLKVGVVTYELWVVLVPDDFEGLVD